MITYEFTKRADRQLQKLPFPVQRRVVKKIKHYIETGDPLHFADTVSGASGKIYRFRIGDYRVIFDWEDNKIVVTEVGPRDTVYS